MSRAVLHFCRGERAHWKQDNIGTWAMPSCECVKLWLRCVELQRGVESQHQPEMIRKYTTVRLRCNMAIAMFFK